MNFDEYAFGSIKIDGTAYEHDLVIDRGEIAKRQKKLSKNLSWRIRTHAPVAGGKNTMEMP